MCGRACRSCHVLKAMVKASLPLLLLFYLILFMNAELLDIINKHAPKLDDASNNNNNKNRQRNNHENNTIAQVSEGEYSEP